MFEESAAYSKVPKALLAYLVERRNAFLIDTPWGQDTCIACTIAQGIVQQDNQATKLSLLARLCLIANQR
jgi:hypothetical protein